MQKDVFSTVSYFIMDDLEVHIITIAIYNYKVVAAFAFMRLPEILKHSHCDAPPLIELLNGIFVLITILLLDSITEFQDSFENGIKHYNTGQRVIFVCWNPASL